MAEVMCVGCCNMDIMGTADVTSLIELMMESFALLYFMSPANESSFYSDNLL